MDVRYINSTKDKLSSIPLVNGQIIFITDASASDNDIYVDFLNSTSNLVERYPMIRKNDAQVPLSSILHIGGSTQTTVAEALNALKNNDVSLPLATSQGGTGNTTGYIQAGRKAGTTIGHNATAEGYNVTASASYAHAEGNATNATGLDAHAEGNNTTASAAHAHAEGENSIASQQGAHAEGRSTQANNWYAHSEGMNTIAGYMFQHVGGKYNDNKADTLFEVGNGTSDNDRSNAFEVYANGDINVNGNIRINGSIMPIGGGVTSFNGRSGSILPIGGDYSADQITYSGNVTAKAKIDEVAGIWTAPVSCAVGDTTCTISNSSITTTSTIRVFGSTSSGKPVRWKQITTTTGQAVITFTSALTEASSVKLHVLNI